MRWPSFADYELFVKDAFDYSVLDPVLKNGKPMRGISGGFSRVYPVKVGSKTFAMRCWVKNVRDAKNRYEQISDYLKRFRLRYFVDFKYVSEGILVTGTKYPITRMEWADGVSLREFIEQNLQTPNIFKSVADRFYEMVSILHKHQIAHGDLQDGNILLKQNGTDVEIKLIDYDSLFVPALRGQPEQILGLPEYQHPKRMTGGEQANEKVDYFSELVIYLSFLGLFEKPDLWVKFADGTRVGSGLLFSKEDFENPSQSIVFQELEKLSPDVQHLTATLKKFCAKTAIDQLEPLEDILPKSDASTHGIGAAVLNLGTDVWRYIADVLGSNWRSIITPALGSVLVICFIAFLTQMNAKDGALSRNIGLQNQLAQKDVEIRQKESKIRRLTTSVQTLENQKDGLSHKNGELQDQLKNRTFSKNMISKEAVNLRKQLSEKEMALTLRVSENQNLRSQLAKKDTELRTQLSTVQRLQNDQRETQNENRKLKSQLGKGNIGGTSQNPIFQQLQKEKSETLTENQRLQGQNQNLIRQNQRLRDENKSLQSQLNNANQNSLDDRQSVSMTRPELPKQVDEYTDLVTRACVYNNNNGIRTFKLKEYDKAVTYFKQAIQADLKVATAHYNLGCVYLEMREYDEAIRAFRTAVTIDYKFKEAYYNLGLAHLGSGDRASAKSSAELALKTDGNYQPARNLLAVIEKVQQ